MHNRFIVARCRELCSTQFKVATGIFGSNARLT
jgi:hypothetical protein